MNASSCNTQYIKATANICDRQVHSGEREGGGPVDPKTRHPILPIPPDPQVPPFPPVTPISGGPSRLQFGAGSSAGVERHSGIYLPPQQQQLLQLRALLHVPNV